MIAITAIGAENTKIDIDPGRNLKKNYRLNIPTNQPSYQPITPCLSLLLA
jgi:hypothetical protein